MIDDSRGKSAYAVFAASVRIAAVASCRNQKMKLLPNTCLPICANTVTLSLGYGLQVMGEDRHAEEQRAEDRRHPRERGRRVLRLVAPERGNAVGDRLDTGERDRARREAAEQDEEAERSAELASGPGIAFAWSNGIVWMPPNQWNSVRVSPKNTSAMRMKMYA